MDISCDEKEGGNLLPFRVIRLQIALKVISLSFNEIICRVFVLIMGSIYMNKFFKNNGFVRETKVNKL